MDIADQLRTSRPATALIGPEYRTSTDMIEIDVTFNCNLRCYNCDRSCNQAPDDSNMTTLQIEKFVRESIANHRAWKRIRILGGEPMLHPDILEILDILIDYWQKYSPATRIEVVTNGHGKEVVERLGKVPRQICLKNTKKSGRVQSKFEAFNLAPCDNKYNLLTDYCNACWITKDCGMGLNRYGYYQCGAAGSIDRVFGFDIGVKQLPEMTCDFHLQKRTLCGLCGHFNRRKYAPTSERIPVKGEPRSTSWSGIYKIYGEHPPILSLY